MEGEPVGRGPALQRECSRCFRRSGAGATFGIATTRCGFRQFGAAAWSVRDEAGSLCGYLLGAPTPAGGYVHVIATPLAVRGRRLGRALYARFAAEVTASRRTLVEAITVPTNTGSLTFHERLGFTATVVKDDAGPGEDRVHLTVDAEALLDGRSRGRTAPSSVEEPPSTSKQ